MSRRWAVLGVSWALVLLTAACGGGPNRPAAERGATTTAGAPGATSPASSTTAAVGPCRTPALTLGAGIGTGALGRIVTDYYFANVGRAACTLIGYPGFAVLDASGTVVQHPAARTPGPGTTQDVPVRTVELGPGQLALFVVANVDNTPNPDCPEQFPGTTLQVYPPGETTPIRRPWDGGLCDLEVGPVQPYSSPTDTTGVLAECTQAPPQGTTASMEPPSIVLACGDGNAGVKDMSWSSWTATSATGTGDVYLNDCTPNCAGGTFHDYPATITLSDVVGGPAGRLFSNMHAVYSGAGPQGHSTDDFEVPVVPG